MSEKLQNIIGAVSFIGLAVSIIMLIGIAGSVDVNTLSIGEAAKRGIIWLIVLALSAGGIVLLEKDEDEYGGL